MTDIEALARQMYAERVSGRALGPNWDQIDAITQDVWRGLARAELFGDLA